MLGGPGKGAYLLLILAVLLPFGWMAASTMACPSDGSAVFPVQGSYWNSKGFVVERRYGSTVLRRGDVVLRVDGTSVGSGGQPARVGQRRVYEVLREGRIETLVVTLTRYPLLDALLHNPALVIVWVSNLVVAGYVFLRRRGHRSAHLMLALSVLLVIGANGFPLGIQVVDLSGGCGIARYLTGDLAYLLFWSVLLHLAITFPRSSSPGGWTRRVLVLGAYTLPGLIYLANLIPVLMGRSPPMVRFERLLLISGPAATTIPLLVLLIFVLRLRRATDEALRRRLWLVLGVITVGLIAYLLLGQIPAYVGGAPLIPWHWFMVLGVLAPLAVGAGILRQDLFGIEVVIRRSLLVGGMLLGVLSVLWATAWMLKTILPAHPFMVATMNGGLAVLLITFRGPQLRHLAVRALYGDRGNPYEVMSQLSRMEAQSDPNRIFPDLIEYLVSTLRLSYVEIQLTGPAGGLESVGRHGSPVPHSTTLLLRREEQTVGRLILAAGPPQEPFGPADERLLDDVARQVSIMAGSALLALALARSRERIVLAREEERRRLRRDLHDGVAPTLAAAKIQTALLALDVAEPNRPQVGKLKHTIQQALDDLGLIIDGMRPPVLDQLGLAEALKEQAHSMSDPRVRLSVQSEVLPALPAAVEMAAYRIGVEAMMNAVRHSGGDECTVSLVVSDSTLVLQIMDDGTGMQREPIDGSARSGVGLESMRERALEVGGRCTVSAQKSKGTVVRAVLPLRNTLLVPSTDHSGDSGWDQAPMTPPVLLADT